MSNQTQGIINQSNPHKYFTMLPNMMDDDLNPHEYRLLGHYMRVCGISGKGICWESTRTTAEITKMSASKVATTRKALAKKGYLSIASVTKETNTLRITIIDKWLENEVES